MRNALFLCVAALGVSTSAAAAPIPLANSIAEFSGLQGQDNWYYGYFNVSQNGPAYDATPGGVDDFRQLSWYGLDTTRWDPPGLTGWQFQATGQPWTALSATEVHPNGSDQWSGGSTNVHWAVRRYVNETAGDLQINWHLAKEAHDMGNGVTGRVFVNGAQVDSAVITFDNQTGVNQSITVPNVPAGAFIDFALDATGTFSPPYGGSGGLGNGQGDLSFMDATVSLVPEPAAVAALAAVLLAHRSRRR